MKHNVRPIISTFQSQNKTKWAPKETHHTFKTFIDLVLKNPKSNLSNGKQEEMEHLVKQKDIIITTADKDGTENYGH